MGYNFYPVDRDQMYLMPPSLRDWLSEDDLAWVILDAVDQMNLEPFSLGYPRERAEQRWGGWRRWICRWQAGTGGWVLSNWCVEDRVLYRSL